ncbi:hypothetical protein MPSEU_000400800 [Mayamaea pseudoterrestris]|nr:hypothetical protein MPSEU_000400800 [Mayamaea pseudoterrestris]
MAPLTQETILAAMKHLPFETTRAARSAVARNVSLLQQQRLPKDVWDAAMRLAAYWSKRCELFGEKYAYGSLEDYFASPDDTTTESSSSSILEQERLETIQVYQTGFISSLPSDNAGRPVVWFDYSRIETQLGKENAWIVLQNHILRCMFYWCHSNPHWRDIVAIALIYANDTHWERSQQQPALDMLQQCFCLKFHAIHVCVLTSPSTRSSVIPAFMQGFRPVSQLPLHLQFNDKEGIRKELQVKGLSLQSIPESIGGLWEYSKFTKSFTRSKRTRASSQENGDQKPVAFSGLNAPMPTSLTREAIIQPVLPLSASHSAFPNNQHTASINPASLMLDDGQFLETSMMQQEGMRQLDEAMDMLPPEDKAAYQAAVRQVPYLVMQESNPVRFLRFEKYNAWAAARHLAAYWTKRVQIFGERAFLPLILSSAGALHQEDIDQIKSGYFTFLPVDLLGRTVVCYDPVRRQNNTLISRMRASFYIWSIICENDLSTTNGFVALVMLGRGTFNPLDTTIKECVDMVVDTFPTFPQSFHIVNSPTGLGQRIFFDLLLPLAVRFMGRLINERTAIHVGEPAELVVKLCRNGLTRQSMPDCIGGSWTFDQHRQWIRDRMEIEYMRFRTYIPMRNYALSRTALVPDVAAQSASLALMPSIEHADVTDKAIIQQHGDALRRTIDSVPTNTKSAYTSAIQQAPEVVDKESNVVPFLRHARFDVKAATSLLLKYWQSRTDIFGSRASLPLQQTGEGALERRDIAVISSAYLICLPEDSSGRSVMFCDGSRLSKSSRESRLRTSFYMFSIAAENVKSQTDGIVLLYVLTEASFDRANKECLQLVVDSLPLSIFDVHLLQHNDSKENASSAHTIDQNLLSYLNDVSSNRVYHHSAPTKGGLAQCLSQHGLSPAGLPKTIGGKYGFDNFVQWQELRTRYEWELPAGISNTEEETSFFNFSRVKRLTDLSAEEKNERKRKLNVIHSRRKRERERIEVEVLEERSIELAEEKSVLAFEEKRLRDLLREAQSCLP